MASEMVVGFLLCMAFISFKAGSMRQIDLWSLDPAKLGGGKQSVVPTAVNVTITGFSLPVQGTNQTHITIVTGAHKLNIAGPHPVHLELQNCNCLFCGCPLPRRARAGGLCLKQGPLLEL